MKNLNRIFYIACLALSGTLNAQTTLPESLIILDNQINILYKKITTKPKPKEIEKEKAPQSQIISNIHKKISGNRSFTFNPKNYEKEFKKLIGKKFINSGKIIEYIFFNSTEQQKEELINHLLNKQKWLLSEDNIKKIYPYVAFKIRLDEEKYGLSKSPTQYRKGIQQRTLVDLIKLYYDTFKKWDQKNEETQPNALNFCKTDNKKFTIYAYTQKLINDEKKLLGNTSLENINKQINTLDNLKIKLEEIKKQTIATPKIQALEKQKEIIKKEMQELEPKLQRANLLRELDDSMRKADAEIELNALLKTKAQLQDKLDETEKQIKDIVDQAIKSIKKEIQKTERAIEKNKEALSLLKLERRFNHAVRAINLQEVTTQNLMQPDQKKLKRELSLTIIPQKDLSKLKESLLKRQQKVIAEIRTENIRKQREREEKIKKLNDKITAIEIEAKKLNTTGKNPLGKALKNLENESKNLEQKQSQVFEKGYKNLEKKIENIKQIFELIDLQEKINTTTKTLPKEKNQKLQAIKSELIEQQKEINRKISSIIQNPSINLSTTIKKLHKNITINKTKIKKAKQEQEEQALKKQREILEQEKKQKEIEKQRIQERERLKQKELQEKKERELEKQKALEKKKKEQKTKKEIEEKLKLLTELYKKIKTIEKEIGIKPTTDIDNKLKQAKNLIEIDSLSNRINNLKNLVPAEKYFKDNIQFIQRYTDQNKQNHVLYLINAINNLTKSIQQNITIPIDNLKNLQTQIIEAAHYINTLKEDRLLIYELSNFLYTNKLTKQNTTDIKTMINQLANTKIPPIQRNLLTKVNLPEHTQGKFKGLANLNKVTSEFILKNTPNLPTQTKTNLSNQISYFDKTKKIIKKMKTFYKQTLEELTTLYKTIREVEEEMGQLKDTSDIETKLAKETNPTEINKLSNRINALKIFVPAKKYFENQMSFIANSIQGTVIPTQNLIKDIEKNNKEIKKENGNHVEAIKNQRALLPTMLAVAYLINTMKEKITSVNELYNLKNRLDYQNKNNALQLINQLQTAYIVDPNQITPYIPMNTIPPESAPGLASFDSVNSDFILKNSTNLYPNNILGQINTFNKAKTFIKNVQDFFAKIAPKTKPMTPDTLNKSIQAKLDPNAMKIELQQNNNDPKIVENNFKNYLIQELKKLPKISSDQINTIAKEKFDNIVNLSKNAAKFGFSLDLSQKRLSFTYKKLSLRNNPDRPQFDTEKKKKEAMEKFQTITEAYENLKKLIDYYNSYKKAYENQ